MMMMTGDKPGPCPPTIEPARWQKMWENAHRAEAMTGWAPITAEGWEKVAVLLMDEVDRLEAEMKELRWQHHHQMDDDVAPALAPFYFKGPKR
jgi:tRNA A37 threonylcarbamoyladenosine modification protein TsaB